MFVIEGLDRRSFSIDILGAQVVGIHRLAYVGGVFSDGAFNHEYTTRVGFDPLFDSDLKDNTKEIRARLIPY